ncbi:helix-turn-helix transcriptional regulator [Aerococcaceae bacterium DSM 111021]|nr:helix-turn-helix transcriptional regulator [Aerococcaceae bacterium DSM 111021]
MKKNNINTSNINDTVNILKVLAHPIRYNIAVTLLQNGVMNVGAIQDALSLPQSTVSQHISKMRQVGLVDYNRKGTKIFYSLTNEKAINVIQGLT